MFNWVDWSVMDIYVAGLVALSVHFIKQASKGLDDCFLGGHSIPVWATGISGMAAQFDLTGAVRLVDISSCTETFRQLIQTLLRRSDASG